MLTFEQRNRLLDAIKAGAIDPNELDPSLLEVDTGDQPSRTMQSQGNALAAAIQQAPQYEDQVSRARGAIPGNAQPPQQPAPTDLASLPTDQLRQAFHPAAGGFVRNEDTGQTLFLNGQPGGMGDTPQEAQKSSMADLMAKFQAAKGEPMRVIGTGNGTTVELSPEAAPANVSIDYSRPPVQVGGTKAYYSKDQPGVAYALDGSGRPTTKVLLGYDMQGSMALNQFAQNQRKTEAEIAHTNAQTQLTRQSAEEGKTPAGYRQTANGNLEAIPGGPADTKLQGALNQDTATLQSTWSDLDRLAASANEVKNHPGLSHITGVAGVFPNVPGGPGANAEALLNTLKSQVAFGVLQNMRNNSKTGGALGNVSDKEGALLQANLAALDKSQSYDEFQKNLQKIIDYSQAAKDRLANAYNLKYQNAARGTQPVAQAPTATKSASAPTPIASVDPLVVVAPDGSAHRFPNAQAAAAFRKAIGQ